MNTSHVVVVASILVAVIATQAQAGDDEFEADRVVLRLRAGASIDGVSSDYGAPVVDAVAQRRLFLLDVPDEIEEEEFAELLANDPRVEFADRNFFARDPGPGTQSFYLASSRLEYDQQFTPGLIRLPEAHQRVTGIGIVIAILDTGVDTKHPAFAAQIIPGGYNFVNNSGDVSDVGDGIDNDDDGQFDEMAGHGTFVAGLVSLAAPGASLLPLKVLDSDGLGTSFRVARGVDFAIAAEADILNMSLGALDTNVVLDEAIRWAEEAGVIVVAAAGNEGHDSPPWSPSAIPFSLAIAATDPFDVRADFTNYGTHIDLCAPGVGMVSTLPDGAYGVADGTSYACPLVAGVAALALQQRPGSTPAQIEERLRAAAVSISEMNPGFDGRLGAGRIAAASVVTNDCRADFNDDGEINSQDFFDYLGAFFANEPGADFNADQAVNSQDFFDFLSAFMVGC